MKSKEILATFSNNNLSHAPSTASSSHIKPSPMPAAQSHPLLRWVDLLNDSFHCKPSAREKEQGWEIPTIPIFRHQPVLWEQFKTWKEKKWRDKNETNRARSDEEEEEEEWGCVGQQAIVAAGGHWVFVYMCSSIKSNNQRIGSKPVVIPFLCLYVHGNVSFANALKEVPA